MSNEILRVRMNITSMHAEKSFLSELTTQMLFGDEVEVLEDYGEWILGRGLIDNYRGLTYRKYLDAFDVPTWTHIIKTPVVQVLDKPRNGQVLSRAFSGTKTSILDEDADMIKIRASYDGWVPRDSLRAYTDIPKDKEALRAMVCESALSLLGVPYLWGGSSSNGIDCSGLAQWAYRMVGIDLGRDAHMQLFDDQLVEPPFIPGDLVFYGERKGDHSSVTHVSISLGGWNVIHSSRARNGVYVDDVQQNDHLRETYLCATRII